MKSHAQLRNAETASQRNDLQDRRTASVHEGHAMANVHRDHAMANVHRDHATASVHRDHATASVRRGRVMASARADSRKARKGFRLTKCFT